MDQRSGVRLPLPLQCAPDPNSLEDPSKGARNPEAEEVPGGEQKIGRPPSTRRRTPLTSVLWELDPGLWPSLISNTKPGVWRPLYPHGLADARLGKERGRSGAAGISAGPETPQSNQVGASSDAHEHLCAPRPPRLWGRRESGRPLLTLQPQVSAPPRALLEPPAATASCEPLRQALTVKKTEQSCSHGAMSVRSPSLPLLCTPAASCEPAPSGRWRRRPRRSGPRHRACASGSRPASSLQAPPPAAAP